MCDEGCILCVQRGHFVDCVTAECASGVIQPYRFGGSACPTQVICVHTCYLPLRAYRHNVHLCIVYDTLSNRFYACVYILYAL